MDASLTTNGARIAYRVAGAGPCLFLVGAPAGKSGFSELAAAVAHAFTVVIHDPRGIGESSLEAGAPVDAGAFADDLHALIQHLGVGKIRLFGASGGAVTGLEMLTRYGDDIAHLVAHEPPLFQLLEGDAFERSEAAFRIGETDPAEGVRAFMDATQIAPPTAPSQLPPPTPTELEKQKYFITRMAPATVRYSADLAALRGQPITCAAGEQSRGQPAHRAAEALARALDSPFLLAPGDHTAPSTAVALFAPWLIKTLSARR